MFYGNICNICNLTIDTINNNSEYKFIYYHDKDYHFKCLKEDFEENGYFQCSYCENNIYDICMEKLITKSDCVIIKNDIYVNNEKKDINYNNKFYHYYCFLKKYSISKEGKIEIKKENL